MSTPSTVNRRIVLARRPRGAPTAEDFRLETGYPVAENFGKLVVRVS